MNLQIYKKNNDFAKKFLWHSIQPHKNTENQFFSINYRNFSIFTPPPALTAGRQGSQTNFFSIN